MERKLGKEEAKELRRLENERDKIQDWLAAVLKPLKKAEIRAFKGIWSCKSISVRLESNCLLFLRCMVVELAIAEI